MSFRTWMFAAAIGVIFSGQAWSQAAIEDEPRQEESAAANQDSGKTEDQPLLDLTPALNEIESAIRDLIAEEDEIATEAQESREKRHLIAQEAMAKWAKLMFFATFATVVLTFVALWYIRKTLIETKAAVGAANRTIDATKEIGRDQSRAYVAVTEVFRMASSLEASSKCEKLTIRINNCGQTPATRIQGKFRVDYLDNSKSIVKVATDFGSENSCNRFAFSGLASQTTVGTEVGVPLTDRPSECVLHISGVIEYETFFGGKWYSEFSFFDDHKDAGGVGLPKDTSISKSQIPVQVYKKQSN